MSKKAQATLKDVIPIFIEELEKAGGQMSKLELRYSDLDSRIQMLLEHRPEFNTESVEKLIKAHQSNLNNAGDYLIRSHTIFSDKVNEEKSSLEDLFAQNQEKLVKINTGKKKKLRSFYLYTAIAFIVAICSVYFGLNKHFKLKQMTTEYLTERDRNIELFNFIQEKDMIDAYKEWYEQSLEK